MSVRRAALLLVGLGGAVVLYLLTRTRSGQIAAVDAVEFVSVSAQRIAEEAWRVSLGLRNRNPGNIDFIANPLQRWRGMKSAPGEGGRFAQFDSDAHGVRAIGKELQLEERRGARTVYDQIAVWAPSNENDVQAYAKAVAKRLGVGSHDPIDVTARLPELAAAIIRVENGVQPYALDDIATWVYS